MLWGKSSARRMAEEVVVATGIGGDLCVREKGLLDQASGPELWGSGGLRVIGGGGGAASTRRLRAPVAAARQQRGGNLRGKSRVGSRGRPG